MNTGVSCYVLLQRIFPTQRLNPHLLRLLHWQLASRFFTIEPPGKPWKSTILQLKSLSFHLLDGYCLIHWIIEQRQGDLEILLCWVLFFCRGQDWVTLVLHSPWAWDSWKEEPPYKSGALMTSSATTDFPSWEHLKPQAALKSLACT